MNSPGLDLTGRLVVVTGGTRGIGRALVDGLVAARAELAVIAHSTERLESLKDELTGDGATVSTYAVDLADTDAVSDAFERITHDHGRIDGLVNNAGINIVGPTIDYDIADARRVLDVNVLGLLAASQAAARRMESGGAIVNVASLSSFIGQPERTAYVASKAAVIGMTKSMAVEWGPRGIRVNAIAPGYIETDLSRRLMEKDPEYRSLVENRTPLRRFGRPADLVGATLFLLSDLASFVSGAHISVDGGWLANGFMR